MNKYFLCNMNINEMEKCSIEFDVCSNLSVRFSWALYKFWCQRAHPKAKEKSPENGEHASDENY